MNEQNTPLPQEEPIEEDLEMLELNAQRFEPLGPWQYFWTSLLYLIPGVGLIAMILQSIIAKNVNRICFARSRLIILVTIVMILVLVLMMLYLSNRLYNVLQIIKLACKAIADTRT